MRIEWDEQKNQINIRKHSLDFADAWKVFQRPILRALDDRKEYGEDRWIGIGLLDLFRVVVIVFTELDQESVRIISLRKALTHERKRYEQAFSDEFGIV